jgi:thymidylate kinase
MQRVIIFDGPDRLGKSTMSKRLSEILGIPRFKNHREKKFFENDPGYFVKALKYGDPYFVSFLEQSKVSVIIDRSFPSEFAYSNVLGRETNMDILRMVDTMYADIGTKIIIPYKTSYEGMKDDQFSIIDSSMLQRLDVLYSEFIRWTSCDVLRLCVDDEDIEHEMAEILDFI